MEDIRVFRSPVFSRVRRWNRAHTPAQPTSEEEYDSDELNDRGAFNYSGLCIVEASQLVEPAGWYLGREYYVVTRGSMVGVFHDLTIAHRSVNSIPSAQWATCKTWQQAVRLWDLAYQSGTICLLREGVREPPAATRRPETKAPAPQSHLATPPVTGNPVSKIQAPSMQPSSSSPSISRKRLTAVIIVSDSESDGDDDDEGDGSGDSDGEIEATYPKEIVKVNDCFDVTDDEGGNSCLRQTHDAATDTHLGAGDGDSDSEIEATYPKKIVKVNDCFDVTDDEDGNSCLRQTYDAATDTHFDTPVEAEAAPLSRCEIQ